MLIITFGTLTNDCSSKSCFKTERQWGEKERERERRMAMKKREGWRKKERKKEMGTKMGRKEPRSGSPHPSRSVLVWSVSVVNLFTDVHLSVRVPYPSQLLQSPWRQALGAGGRPLADHHPLFFFFLGEKWNECESKMICVVYELTYVEPVGWTLCCCIWTTWQCPTLF